MLLTHDEETNEKLSNINRAPKTARVMYLLGIDDNTASEICNEINEKQLAAAHPTLSWSGGGRIDVHVTHTEATKEHALEIWHEIEDITQDETIGMGDSGNDVPLFQSSGLKVAVSNATLELKSLADYIAPNDNQQALEHVIKHFVLKE